MVLMQDVARSPVMQPPFTWTSVCRVQALVLSPTRELATQTEKNISAIGDYMSVQVCKSSCHAPHRQPPQPCGVHPSGACMHWREERG